MQTRYLREKPSLKRRDLLRLNISQNRQSSSEEIATSKNNATIRIWQKLKSNGGNLSRSQTFGGITNNISFPCFNSPNHPVSHYLSMRHQNNMWGVDVTYLRTEVSHGLYITYPEVPIVNLQSGSIEYMTITKRIVTVQVEFVGFMDDKNLQDKTWSQWL